MKTSSSQGDLGTLPSLIHERVDAKADVIVARQDETLQAAVQRVKTIPIVFNILSDPFAAGAGTSDSNPPGQHHRGLLAGLWRPGAGPSGSQLIKRVVPKVKKIGILFSPAEPLSVSLKDKMTMTAKKAGLGARGGADQQRRARARRPPTALVGKKVDAIEIYGNAAHGGVREHHPGRQGRAKCRGFSPVAVRNPQGRDGGLDSPTSSWAESRPAR